MALLKVRLPQDVSDEVDEDPTGNKALWDRGLLNGASQKVRHHICSLQLSYTVCVFSHERLESLLIYATAPCGAGAPLFPPCPFTSFFFSFYFSLSFIGFTYFLLLSIPSLSNLPE